MSSVTLNEVFAECFWAFAECPWHSQSYYIYISHACGAGSFPQV